jgi:hypothetical protein
VNEIYPVPGGWWLQRNVNAPMLPIACFEHRDGGLHALVLERSQPDLIPVDGSMTISYAP